MIFSVVQTACKERSSQSAGRTESMCHPPRHQFPGQLTFDGRGTTAREPENSSILSLSGARRPSPTSVTSEPDVTKQMSTVSIRSMSWIERHQTDRRREVVCMCHWQCQCRCLQVQTRVEFGSNRTPGISAAEPTLLSACPFGACRSP